MRKLLYIVTALLLGACSKKEDVFYSTTYPVTKVEIQTSIPDGTEASLAALIEEAAADAEATAPVSAGGAYQLDFSRYNGGELYITPTAGAEALIGEFDKVPASYELTFRYGEQNYLARLTPYTPEEEALRCVLFEINLTEYYKVLYPALASANFKVVRKEYTSHLYD